MAGTGGFTAGLRRAGRYGCAVLPPGKVGAGLIMDGGFSMNKQMNRGWAGMTVLALAMGLQGCGGDEDTTAVVRNIPVNTPAAIAQESADDYEPNVNGLITASTLKRWKDDWANQRPAGITGKLVILQVSAGQRRARNTSSPTAATCSPICRRRREWIQTRTNGVIETPSMVPDGAAMDALLKKYNIDPTKRHDRRRHGHRQQPERDGAGPHLVRAALLGRRPEEPGDPQRRQPVAGYVANGREPPPTSRRPQAPRRTTAHASVKNLLVDNTQLQATVDDMLKVLPSTDTNVKNDGVLIWDARSISPIQCRRNGGAR